MVAGVMHAGWMYPAACGVFGRPCPYLWTVVGVSAALWIGLGLIVEADLWT